MILLNAFLAAAHTLAPQLKALKDDLHRHPELAFHEVRTTALLRERLTRLDLELIDLGMETGVVALLRGGAPGKTVALRADIDGLPYQEPAGGAVVSEVPGRMHACGHDFHTAGLYGAARLLAARRQALHGDVVFLFQPAEETTNGAQAMIGHGLWEKLPKKPDCLFGLHNRPEIATGYVAVAEGALMAGKTSFALTLRGVGGHGGSPHRCVDVLVAAAAVVGGAHIITPRPALGSEDFAVFAQDVPAFFYWLGVGFPDRENATWHNEGFRTDDSALPLAAALLAQSALEGLA